MKRLILLMAAMGAAMLVVGGVAYALSVQCDGVGDQDPETGVCQGTEQNDVITGTALRDSPIFALGGMDVVNARGRDDNVDGGRGADDISGGVGGDALFGGMGLDHIQGGAGTTDDPSDPPNSFECAVWRDDNIGVKLIAFTQGNQVLTGDNGNDDLDGGEDNDLLQGDAVGGAPGTNDLSGNGGNDCLQIFGDPNERVSAGKGNDVVFAAQLWGDGNGDDIFCGPGHDAVLAEEYDRVAADCEIVHRPTPLQVAGSTPEAEVTGEVTITTPEGTTTMTPEGTITRTP